MASILRSSKFVRYIAGFARNIVLNTPRECDGNFLNTAQCICGGIPRPLTTQFSAQHEQTLDQSLRRIDQDVRKSGRISRRDIEDVLEEIRSTRSATSSQSLLVIRCCGNLVPEELPEVRTKLVQEIWSTLRKLNVPMDISHYNALLRVYLENEYDFSPTDFLSELEAKGIEPNRVTYQRLIARYCQTGDIEGATKILEFMREKQLPVNENVFNALIIGHSESGDMDSAQGILGVMTQTGLEPSADTYTTLLCGYGKKGDIEAINKLFRECEEKDIFLLDKDFLDIVYSLATNGHIEHVPAILNKVRRAIGYNHDAVNIILRLINKGQEDAAFLVLQSMVRGVKEDGASIPLGNFFIKQLIKAERPIEKIVELCTKLEEHDLYNRAFTLAAETSLEQGNERLAYALMEQLQTKGINVRQHFFWPLIVSKKGSNSDIIRVLLEMNKYNLTPNAETLRDYVIPSLKGRSGDIISLLREANVSVGSSATSLAHYLLEKNEIEEVATIVSGVPAYYNPEFMKSSLTKSFYHTNNLNAYIRIIRAIYENLDRRANLDQDNASLSQAVDKAGVVGSFVLDLFWNRSGALEALPKVLQALIDEGLSISTASAEKLQEKIGEKMTEDISNMLGKLTSGELTPVPFVKNVPVYTPSSQMSIPQLETLVENLEGKGQDTKGLKRQLLTLYYREKDLEKTEELVKDLEENGFVFTPGLYAQLCDLYAYHDNLEKALHYFELLKTQPGSDFLTDESKTIRLAHLLVKNGRLDEAINILETTPKSERRVDERSFNYSALVWRFFNYLAEEGRVQDLDRVFDTLVKHNYIEVTNSLLGPLIKVHLIRDDIDKALEKFEWSVTHYRATPWKNELACKLIQSEDAEKLQKLTDLSASVHGEINSLYDLVFAFVECGRIRQARKILETPGLQNRPNRINAACDRYRQEGSVKSLEGLKDATKDLSYIDRSDIYYQLLLSYMKQEDCDKALGLWTQMQEEDIAPTDQFLSTLGQFLKKNERHIPFSLPVVPVTQPQSQIQSSIRQNTNSFKHKIRTDNVEAALQHYYANQSQLSTNDVSMLVEKLLQAGRLDDAAELTKNQLQRNAMPLARVFRFMLNKLATAGKVEILTDLGANLNQETKKLLSYDNRLCHANLVAGKGAEYLDQLEREIDQAPDAELNSLGEKFPRGGAYGILERYPELLEKFTQVAEKYAKRGVIAPMNVLWTHYFSKADYEAANQLWEQHLKGAPRIMFQKIVHDARDKHDENLIRQLIEHLRTSNVTEGALGNAYSCLLDILVASQKHDEIVSAFEAAVKEAGINHINRTAVLRVKEVYEKLQKPFNYTVPAKHNRPGTTSSSED